MQNTTDSRAPDIELTPLGTCSRGADPPPGVACFVAALETGAWRHEKHSRVRARFLERQKWQGMGGAYNLPAREAVLACHRIRPQLPAKRAGYFEQIMEGGRIDGEIMG